MKCKRCGSKMMDRKRVAMDINERLKEARYELGFALRDVERLTGISNPYLSQLETGKIKSPSFKVVIKLIEFYGLNISDFMTKEA